MPIQAIVYVSTIVLGLLVIAIACIVSDRKKKRIKERFQETLKNLEDYCELSYISAQEIDYGDTDKLDEVSNSYKLVVCNRCNKFVYDIEEARYKSQINQLEYNRLHRRMLSAKENHDKCLDKLSEIRKFDVTKNS